MDQTRTPYVDALKDFASSGHAHFSTPGHGFTSPRLTEYMGEHGIKLDVVPLISGIDVGDNNALQQARELAAEAWGARKTWFLINGASQGNRMSLMALASLTDRMLIQRNSHSSVFDGLVMSGITPVYVSPEIDYTHQIAQVVTPEAVATGLREQVDAGTPVGAVLIVSPNYFGAVADVSSIAGICAEYDVPLIVDGSWGAHFGFHEQLPPSAITQGADVLLASIHKLGGSLTQTAMLHLAESKWADQLEPLLDSGARLTESTSASSILLASLDIARADLATGTKQIGASITVANKLRNLVEATDGLRLAEEDFAKTPGVVRVDPLHIVIDVSALGVDGIALHSYLADSPNRTVVEISTPTTIVAIIGAGATPDVDGFIATILSAAKELASKKVETLEKVDLPSASVAVMTPREAYLSAKELVPADQAVGRVAADLLAAYPPGIPNLVPGEIVTDEIVAYLRHIAAGPSGYVRGAADALIDQISVCVAPATTSTLAPAPQPEPEQATQSEPEQARF